MSFLFWNPEADKTPIRRVPITILSGFLGAGKTTLLNQILTKSSGRKIAVVVNDLGEINIDASLIKSAGKEVNKTLTGMLELQGGCICCSIQTDLLDALLELWRLYDPEHILVEATGVAEPKAILETLYAANSYGRRGIDFLKVANLVTVVDGGNLETYFSSSENTGQERRHHLLQSNPQRPLQELLMEQIECADILLINKVDTLEEDARQRILAYLGSLNHHVEVWESRFGRIDVERFMQEHRFSEEQTLTASAWQQIILDNEQGRKSSWKLPQSSETKQQQLGHHEHDHDHEHHHHDHEHHHDEGDHDHHHKDYGLETFVFNARTPFHESRFLRVLRNGLSGVIRAKGFYWTEDTPTRVGLLSISGKMLRADYLSEWWHTMVQRGAAQLDDMPELVRRSWLPVFGDRRQELVFIGINLDRERIKKALRDCFVKDNNK